MSKDAPRLGLGGIESARRWGKRFVEVPSVTQVNSLHNTAFQRGIRVFDTAPSYGTVPLSGLATYGEFRLGTFLEEHKDQRNEITVITKFGEFLDPNHGIDPYTDHSYDGLMVSLSRSVHFLGTSPDILLIHKATPDVVKSEAVQRAMTDATSQYKIEKFGVSISNPQVAMETLALHDTRIKYIQLPYNSFRSDNEAFRNVIKQAHAQGVHIIVNRPFEEGTIPLLGSLETDETTRRAIRTKALTDAFKFAMAPLNKDDIVLTGTGSIDHLNENVDLYKAAAGSRRTKLL